MTTPAIPRHLLTDAVLPSDLEEALPPEAHVPWAVWRSVAGLLARLLLHVRPRAVLEFGAGCSSLVIARALAHNGGGRLTSIDQSPQHSADVWADVATVPGVDVRLLPATLRTGIGSKGVMYRYQVVPGELAERGPYDFVFIDGPPFFYGRDATLHLVYPHLSPGAVILMDDARRGSEQRAIRRWLRSYPALHLDLLEPDFGGDKGHGIAVLRYEKKCDSRGSLQNFTGTTLDWLWTWRHIRWKLRTLSGSN